MTAHDINKRINKIENLAADGAFREAREEETNLLADFAYFISGLENRDRELAFIARHVLEVREISFPRKENIDED